MILFQAEVPNDLLKNQTLLGIVVAGIGAAVVRWLDRSLQQKTIIHDENEKLRVEFRELNELLQIEIKRNQDRITELAEKLQTVEDELVAWKDKYYALIARIASGDLRLSDPEN